MAYSTPQAAYEKIEAAFQKTAAGKNVKFTQSYGASGDQSRAVESGLPADYVAFSLETDMTRLVKDKIVAPDWNSDQYKGKITDSVVALVVRKGNPKNIKTFADLTKKGVDVITPEPVLVGCGALEHHGRLRFPDADRQVRGPGHRVPQQGHEERLGAGRQRSRGAADLHRRQGRRAHLL